MPNRLAASTSPYLRQHADNPVEWWEWGEDAFAEARRRNVPVLLSVGYAACHWCHVMAHESFEDDVTAAYLNEHFVAIKVDREERPDIDAIYMSATTAMTGHGGWPMTCVLDHDASPFFAGTYFPDRPRHGQPSFRQVLEALVDAWANRGDDVRAAAASIRAHLDQRVEVARESVDVDAAVGVLEGEYDARAGGFGGAPKFPPSMVLEFLRLQGSPAAERMHRGTLEAMARGGIHDQIGGGFARYSVDAGWVVPHFEKMLYDNAQLLTAYAEVGDAWHDDVADGIADFVLRELRTDEGAFASALDADTEGEEGRFYVWTPAHLLEVLGPDDGVWAAETLGVTASGTFEHGTSTLRLPHDPEDRARFADVRTRLLAARERRTRPARDDKAVTAWNGLAISGLARAGVRLGRADLIAAAERAADAIWTLNRVDGRLRRASLGGTVGSAAGVLDDHGCYAAGLLDLVRATGDARWLERAAEVLDLALSHFRAPDGGFFDTADDAETLLTRPREFSDNASPSGQSATVAALATYAALTGSGRHRDAAEEGLGVLARVATRAPRFAGLALAAAVAMQRGPVEIAVVGRRGPEREALAAAAYAVPGAVVVVGAPDPDGRAGIPLLRSRDEVDGGAAAYVCRDLVCARPVTTPEALRAGLRD